MLPVSGRPSKGWRAEQAGGGLRQNAFVGLNMKLTRKAVPSLTVCSTSSSEWVMVLVRSGLERWLLGSNKTTTWPHVREIGKGKWNKGSEKKMRVLFWRDSKLAVGPG